MSVCMWQYIHVHTLYTVIHVCDYTCTVLHVCICDYTYTVVHVCICDYTFTIVHVCVYVTTHIQ